jgi:hemerythrin
VTSWISAAHRSTAALLEETRAVLGGGDRDAVRQALTRLGEVLDAHFEQEDRLYHSAIAALQPERRTTLHGFAEAHRELRTRLAEIARHLEHGGLEETLEAFEAFVPAFRRHEAEEERLLRSLDEQIAGVRGAP